MTDDQQQQPQSFPQFPNGLSGIHPKQQAPLNKMLSKALTAKLARHPRSGIKTNQTVHFGRRGKQQTRKWKAPLPYY